MRYERSLAVTRRLSSLLALVHRGDYSSSALAKELGVSEQTVYRDIMFLRQQGHRIQAVKRSVNWAYQVLDETAKVGGDHGGRRS